MNIQYLNGERGACSMNWRPTGIRLLNDIYSDHLFPKMIRKLAGSR
jgi:hypothetical protein